MGDRQKANVDFIVLDGWLAIRDENVIVIRCLIAECVSGSEVTRSNTSGFGGPGLVEALENVRSRKFISSFPTRSATGGCPSSFLESSRFFIPRVQQLLLFVIV